MNFQVGVYAPSDFGFNLGVYDYIAVTYPSGTQTVYTYYIGGSGGTIVGILTINYVDSTQAQILNVSKTV